MGIRTLNAAVDDADDRGQPNGLAETIRRRASEAEGEPADLRDRLAPVPAFPTAVLPATVGRYVVVGAQALGCPVDYVGTGLLAAAATLVGQTRRIRLTPTWEEAARLYVACVGEPADGKTPALRFALAPVHRFQAVLFADYERWRAEATARGDGQGDGDAPEEAYHVAVADTTIEALFAILKANPAGVCAAWDELAGWIKSQNAYRNGFGSDREFWQAAWSGSPYAVDRKGRDEAGRRPSYMLESPFVCVAGGIQPDLLRSLVTTPRGKDTGRDGTLERLLFAWPDGGATRPTGDLPAETEQSVRELLAGLLALRLVKVDGHWRPRTEIRVLPLDAGARVAWEQAEDGYWLERSDPGVPAWWKGTAGKLRSYRARLALVLAMLRTGGEAEAVAQADMEGACALCGYYGAHFRRVWRFLYGTELEGRLAAVMAWVRRHGKDGVTVRELVRSEVAGIATAQAARNTFSQLETLDLGRTEIRPRRGAKPAEVFVPAPLTELPDKPDDPAGGGAAAAFEVAPSTRRSPDDPGQVRDGPAGSSGGSSGDDERHEPRPDGRCMASSGLSGEPYKDALSDEPPVSCPACRGTRHWRRGPGWPWVCTHCHPAVPGAAGEEVDTA